MFSRLLLAPFAVGTIYFLYRAWQYESGFSIWLLPFVLISVIIYLFSPQLDWWWHNRHPPELHERLRQLLQQFFPFYRKLSLHEKERFRKRMALYMEAMEFRPMGGPESVPEDVRGFIAAAATQMSFGQADYLMNTFEHIIIYIGAFPSPQHPRHLHTTESYAEDGALLFAAKSIMDSTTMSPKAYHIALHEYANVFKVHFRNKTFPTLDETTIWQSLTLISGMDKTFITESIGLPEVDAYAVSVHHFFVFSKKFKEFMPQLYQQYTLLFNLDPLQGHDPVVDDRFLSEKVLTKT